MIEPIRAAIYARVSSTKQACKSGLPRQLEGAWQFCRRRQWDIVGVWTEIGSAADEWKYRPILRELVMHHLRPCQADVLVIEDMDRLTRGGVEDWESLEQAIKAHGCWGGVVLVYEPWMAAQVEARRLRRAYEELREQAERERSRGREAWLRRGYWESYFERSMAEGIAAQDNARASKLGERLRVIESHLAVQAPLPFVEVAASHPTEQAQQQAS